jgi:hypothetical protein
MMPTAMHDYIVWQFKSAERFVGLVLILQNAARFYCPSRDELLQQGHFLSARRQS